MELDLEGFLDNVVADKEDEYELTGHDEVVEGVDIAQELHCLDGPGGNHTPCSRQLKRQSGQHNKSIIKCFNNINFFFKLPRKGLKWYSNYYIDSLFK